MARGSNVRIKRLRQLHVHGAVSRDVQRLRAHQVRGAIERKIGIRSSNVSLVEMEHALMQRGAYGPLGLERNALQGDGELVISASPLNCFGWRNGPATLIVPPIAELPLTVCTWKARRNGATLRLVNTALARVSKLSCSCVCPVTFSCAVARLFWAVK